MRKQILLVGLFVLAACGCSSSGSSNGSGGSSSTGGSGNSGGTSGGNNCTLAGTYSASVNSSQGAGTSVMTLNSDGSFDTKVTFGATSSDEVSGSYTTSNGQITFLNSSHSSVGSTLSPCLGTKGTYSTAFSSDCSQLTLTKVSDSCADRAQEDDGTVFKRQ